MKVSDKMNNLREAASMVIDRYLMEGSHSHPNFSCTMCGTGEHGYYPEKDHAGADTAKCGNCGSTNSMDFMKSDSKSTNGKTPLSVDINAVRRSLNIPDTDWTSEPASKPSRPRAKKKGDGGEPFIGRDGRINSPGGRLTGKGGRVRPKL